MSTASRNDTTNGNTSKFPSHAKHACCLTPEILPNPEFADAEASDGDTKPLLLTDDYHTYSVWNTRASSYCEECVVELCIKIFILTLIEQPGHPGRTEQRSQRNMAQQPVAVTQIHYFELADGSSSTTKLENYASFREILDTCERYAGFVRAYWGRSLEHPQHAQLHIGSSDSR